MLSANRYILQMHYRLLIILQNISEHCGEQMQVNVLPMTRISTEDQRFQTQQNNSPVHVTFTI